MPNHSGSRADHPQYHSNQNPGGLLWSCGVSHSKGSFVCDHDFSVSTSFFSPIAGFLPLRSLLSLTQNFSNCYQDIISGYKARFDQHNDPLHKLGGLSVGITYNIFHFFGFR